MKDDDLIKAMKLAGSNILWDYDPPEDIKGDVVWDIYQAMEKVRKDSGSHEI